MQKNENKVKLFASLRAGIFCQDDELFTIYGKSVIGAELELWSADGIRMDSWVTTADPHQINYLAPGDYVLRETQAPEADGYVLAQDVAFQVKATGEIQKVEMKDDYTKMKFLKVDCESGEPVIGAELAIVDMAGKEILRFHSTGEPYVVEYLAPGEYLLEERTVPDGYVSAEPLKFIVESTPEFQLVVMEEDVTKVEITKTDLVSGEPVIGAELVIFDSEGTEVVRFITEEEPYYMEKLPIGEYILHEEGAPDGFAYAMDVPFSVKDTQEIQKVDMCDDIIRVAFLKVDANTGVPVVGATLSLMDMTGAEIDTWVTTDKPHYMDRLAAGEYRLKELAAPRGYVTAADLTVTVTNTSNEIQKFEMKDDFTKLRIRKVDAVTGEPVVGANLMLLDWTGNEVANCYTDCEGFYQEYLPVGTYTLCEVTAPDGYEIAESISFTVQDMAELQEVTMKDQPVKKPEEPVQTGDNTHMLAAGLLMLAAVGGLAILICAKKNH